MQSSVLPVLLLAGCVTALAIVLLLVGNLFNPGRPSPVKRMPYESGMDPFHDTRRRFDIRFHLVAIAFLVFDVELLFLYPWAAVVRSESATAPPAAVSIAGATVAADAIVSTVPATAASGPQGRESVPWVRPVFAGGMLFMILLTLGFVYDWRKGVFRWR